MEHSNLNVGLDGLAGRVGISLTTLTSRSPDGDNNSNEECRLVYNCVLVLLLLSTLLVEFDGMSATSATCVCCVL